MNLIRPSSDVGSASSPCRRGACESPGWRGRLALALGVALCSTGACRIREDAPPAPSAAASAAPSASASSAPRPSDAGGDASAEAHDAEPPPEGSQALAFAGLGTGPAAEPSLRAAIRAALNELGDQRSAARAAVAAVVVLEDDPALNAGTGVALRADGISAECDAAVMELTAEGSARFAGVAAVSGIKNPVRVAERLLGAPSPVLSGQGAKDFAARVGIAFPPAPQPAQLTGYRAALVSELRDAGSVWRQEPWSGYVNRERLGDAGLFLTVDAATSDARAGDAGATLGDGGQVDAALATPGASSAPSLPPGSAPPPKPTSAALPPPAALPAPRPAPATASASSAAPAPASAAASAPAPAPRPTASKPPSSATKPKSTPADTVALLVRDANNLFAVAASSGGPPLALPGRVGDVAVVGAGIYVGKQGAVAITGRGELLVELQLARRVYERLELTHSARISAVWGIKQLPKGEQAGIAVLGKRDAHVAQSGDVAWLGWSDGKWSGPEVSK